MAAKREQKKERNETRRHDRDTVKSFQEFGQSTMVRGVKDMNEKQRKQFESSLDDEAANAFRGLMRITEKAEKQHTSESDMFDSVRQVMALVKDYQFAEAHKQLLGITSAPNRLFKVRSLLVRIGQDVSALASHAAGKETLRRGETVEGLIGVVKKALLEVISYASSKTDNMADSDFDVVAQVEVNLPNEIEGPTIVEKVTLLVLPDRKLKTGSGVHPLASGVYLIDATLVGVPNEIPLGEREAAAQTFALKKLRATVSPFQLTRPDSDGTWFPVFKQAFAAQLVHFPDQARRYYGMSTAINEQADAQLNARLLRAKRLRAEFESSNREVFEELAVVQRELDDCKYLTHEINENFALKFKFKPTTIEAANTGLQAQKNNELALVGENFKLRTELIKIYQAKVVEAHRMVNQMIAVKIRAKRARDTLAEIEAEIVELKASAINPFHQIRSKLANINRAA